MSKPKPKPIQIKIPNPCTQSWAEMTPDGQGRHCAHCEKTVVDFTTWSDTALYDYFSKNTSRTCGRFFAEQLVRPLHIPPQPHSRLYRMTVALGLTLIFTQVSGVYAQQKPPRTAQRIEIAPLPQANSLAGGTLSGIISGVDGKRLSFAKVSLFRENVNEKTVYSDSSGHYLIERLDPGDYQMVVTRERYYRKEIDWVRISNKYGTILDAQMDRDRFADETGTFMTGDVAIDEPLGKKSKAHRVNTKKYKK